MITSPPSNPTWSTYFNDPSPNSILFHTTSDGLLLSLPRFILQAASHVFEDVLAIPQSPSDSPSKPYDGQNAPGILPEVRLQDVKGSDLEWALRLAHRDHVELATKELRDDIRLRCLTSPKPVEEIYRIIVIADKFALHGIVPILFDTLSQSNGYLLKAHFLEILVVAIVFRNPPLAELAIDSWAAEETREHRWRTHAEEWAKLEDGYFEPPDAMSYPFGTTSIKHTKDGKPDTTVGEQGGAWYAREEEEADIKVNWRWRPKHVSDLGEDWFELIPKNVLRVLLRAETEVLHSMEISWERGKYSFLGDWDRLLKIESYDDLPG